MHLFTIGLLVAALLPCRLAAAEVRPAIPLHSDLVAAISPREITRGPLGLKQIALTFDAGSEADDFPKLLQVLEKFQVKATFFLTGKWAQRYPDEARQLKETGHAIGNHSWAHPEYTTLSNQHIRLDLIAADTFLSRAFGKSVRPLFRPPFGDRDKRVLTVLGDSGYFSIYWTIDTLDSIEPRKSPAFLTRRVLDRTDTALDGAIILSHVGYPETVAALPAIIKNLRARGFQFVTITDWLPAN